MNTKELAGIVLDASRTATRDYLQICGLDSPWEVPEAFLAVQAARALNERGGLRVAIEFNLGRASNAPTGIELRRAPTRLQRAYSHLDVAILKLEADPWQLRLDGIVEFKKHSSLEDDAKLIEFMIDQKRITHGVLAMLIVGSSPQRVQDEYSRLTDKLIESGRWESASTLVSSKQAPVANSDVGDRWWDMCCLVAV